MTQTPEVDLDGIFSALAHPIRRAIIERLAAEDAQVAELAAPHDVSAPAISKHLRVLEEAGLVEVTPEGRVRRCTLVPGPLQVAFGWLTRYRVFWEDRLDALGELLEETAEEAVPSPPPRKKKGGRTR